MRRWARVAIVIANASLAAAACGDGDVAEVSPPLATPDGGGGSLDAAQPADDGGSTNDAGDDASSPSKYDADGPGTYATSTASVTNGASTFTLSLYVPSSAGLHPVVSVNPGLQQPATGYTSYAKRLASYGVVVLLRDDPGFLTQTPGVVSDLTYLVATWLPAQAAADAGGALAGKVDLTKVALLGHSRGGQATLLAAENGLKGKVVAWFGLDPVDSSVLNNTQARTNLAQIGIPTGFLGATVSSSCSPAADNYEVLYAAAPSPSVVVKGVGAGHTQVEDPAGCVACNLCSPAGTADGAAVLAYSVRYATAFFARELLGDASVGTAFQGAGAAADVAAGRVQIASK